MQLKDFYYDLPDNLIARFPTPNRTASRLLTLQGESGNITHNKFTDISSLLNPGDLLVFNNTRVIPARLFGRKATGGQVEVFIERVLDEHRVLAHVKASKQPKPGSRLILENKLEVTVHDRQQDFYELTFHHADPVLSLLDRYGHMPLPPYLKRQDQASDRERYQTVYGECLGAVAAPTAGLHFDQNLLNILTQRGINSDFVTLHVGAGTFLPVRTEIIEDHIMHYEYAEVSPTVCKKIHDTKAAGHRVVAVGTTSVRSLETAAQTGVMLPFSGETNIFIYPGYSFKCVDAMITNFHAPESTLLMLLCAFAGYEEVMQAYQAAMTERYRFLSYGDAMFVTPKI